MATTIPQKIKLRICHNAKCSFKLLSVYIPGAGFFAILLMFIASRFDLELNAASAVTLFDFPNLDFSTYSKEPCTWYV
jgi:hypothetical protein